MNIQPICNKPYNTNFQKLVIKNPQDMPTNIYKAFVENDSIQFLTKKMHDKGIDLIASYESSGVNGSANPPKIKLENAKQFYNKYFNYSEAPYHQRFSKFYEIRHKKYISENYLLEELYFFDPFDVKLQTHSDICKYFAEIFAKRDANKPVEKKSFWQKLFNKF